MAPYPISGFILVSTLMANAIPYNNSNLEYWEQLKDIVPVVQPPGAI